MLQLQLGFFRVVLWRQCDFAGEDMQLAYFWNVH